MNDLTLVLWRTVTGGSRGQTN
ncbi:unnamed protein product [Callosobruchus maculatus]|uniref:Uncharacterized protein n=1 Tax=Callosobruchus maculatus TaxID=64391 RepID=A0A653CDB0_CALMS|nr:unnamed protein product [Callosobruchus maculatus]VEN45190.1 unnamed protein product [Callosobruchus maculatus]VEN45858.1 unnamed protein product [Callosobruchus maculatus]VEN45903.1 unnamed protein product [Callosobruchus maculatus]